MTTDAFPGREFAGRIVRIAPLLKETSRQARVEIEIPNSNEDLKPGMFVRVQIQFARQDDAVVVPVAALARREGRQGVFIVDRGNMKADFVPVTLGITEGEIAEVTHPPLSGEVVTMGHHLLEDGGAVRLPGAGGHKGSFYVNQRIPNDQAFLPPARTTTGRYEDSMLDDLIPLIERDILAGRIKR